tara:strand:+ start:1396 stop:2295 length:900 start_codon:yes stop_codon:yes gene_type:complete
MKQLCILFSLIIYTTCYAQDSIVHTFDINPLAMTAVEVLEITTDHEYLFRVDKDKVIDGITLSVSPANYERIEGDDCDYLLFDSSFVKITLAAILPDSFFTVSSNGTHSMSLDFHYSYVDLESFTEFDSTTNNFVYSIIHINDAYKVIDYKLDPDIQRKRIDGNILRFKGLVEKMHIEVQFVPRETIPKRKLLQKEIQIDGDVVLKIWDDIKEDGDIINLWIGDFCIAENLTVSKKKMEYKISESMFGSNDTLEIRIDNVDEGKVPPNTVIAELRGKGVKENMRINTTSNMSKIIVLTK